MTDQQMDDRLRAAGERFRAATADSEPSADAAGRVTPTRTPRRSRFLLVAAAAAVVALVVGLTVALRGSTHSAPPSIDNAGLLGNVWLLSANGHPSTSALYISPSGQLVADDECQVIGAKAAVTGSRLTISGRIVRLKSCVDPGFSPTFTGNGTKVLRGTVTFHIDSRGMTVSHRGVGSLRFVLAQTPIPPPSLDIPTLTGTDWVAPNGNVLHIDPATGELSGGYCTGRAVVLATTIRFTSCYRIGLVQYRASVAANVLTLSPAGTTHGRNPGFRQTFAWRPADPAAIDATALTGRTWHLQTVNGAPASSGSLRIDGTTAVIDDGCTTYHRSVTVGSGTFTIAGGAPPQACTDQATTADSFLFTKAATWTVRNGKLIVYGGGSQEFALVYAPGAAVQTDSALEGVTWTIPRWGMYLVVLGDGTARLSDGCTSGTYAAQVAGDRLTVGKMLVGGGCTRPYFPPGMVSEGKRYNEVLRHGTVTWSVSGNTLTVTKAGLNPLTFTTDGTPAPTLAGTDWVLSRISGGNSGDVPVVDTRARLSLDASGQLRADDQCNQLSANARVEQATFILGPVARTGKRCAGLLARGTHLIDSVLSGTVRFRITGNELVLSNTDDSILVTYVPDTGQDDPANLVGTIWTLLSSQHGTTLNSAIGTVTLSFPDRRTMSIQRCYSSGSAVRLDPGTIVIQRLHVTVPRPCPSGPPGTQAQNDFIDRVMTGHVLWSIVGDTLRIANPMVGILTFGH